MEGGLGKILGDFFSRAKNYLGVTRGPITINFHCSPTPFFFCGLTVFFFPLWGGGPYFPRRFYPVVLFYPFTD